MKILLTLAMLFLSSQVNAATYYVRNDGGTISQCDGTHDLPLAGATDSGDAGSTPDCAVSHPAWVLGTGSAGVFAAGDTMIIDNVDQNVGSGQAQYVVGYTMPNLSGCVAAGSDYDCKFYPIPAGIDINNKTKIYGKGYGSCSSTATTSKAQLWGQGRSGSFGGLLNGAGGNIDIQCLEITDHSACIENGPSDGNTPDGKPVKCNRTGTGTTDGDWGGTGIYFGASGGSPNVIIKDVDVHGMANRSIFAYRMGDITVTNSNFISGGFVGWDSDGTGDDSYTGSTILDDVKIQFSGCGEIYPRTNWDWDSTTDLHHCWSQSQGGYGDGIGLGDGDPGNWTLKNGTSISWNASDGVDLLHGSGGSGTLLMERSRAEGNAGQQVKGALALNYIENSLVIGNCGFFSGQSFTSTKDSSGSSQGFDSCRAAGDTIAFANATGGQKMYINNSTITSNGDSAVISAGIGASATTACNGSTLLQVRNSIFRIGRQWADDTANNGAGGNDTTGFYYASGADGNGSGTCGSLNIDEDYNIIYSAKTTTSQCGVGPRSSAGTHSICNQDPVFATTPSMGPTTYITAPTTLTGWYLQVTSPAINLGLTSITTLQDGSADYNSFARGAQWDSGGFEYGTSAGGGGGSSSTGGVKGSISFRGITMRYN